MAVVSVTGQQTRGGRMSSVPSLPSSQSVENNGFSLAMRPRDFQEAISFCERLANSKVCPASFRGDVIAIMVCIEAGERLGYGVLQSLQNIAVINGKPSIYGDELLARVRRSGLLESFNEDVTLERAICTLRRKGDAMDTVVTFSQDDAKKAKLWGKQGPWTEYPKRMLQMRARGFALRDAFPDVIGGMITAEEAEDVPVHDDKGRCTTRPAGPIVECDPKTGEVAAEAFATLLGAIGMASTRSEMMSLVARIKQLSDDEQARMRPLFARRKGELVASGAWDGVSKMKEMKDERIEHMHQSMQQEMNDIPVHDEVADIPEGDIPY